MAQQTVVRLTDDLDGGKAAETVTFALDGITYEIDLSGRNAKALRAAIAPYASKARRQSSTGARVTKRTVLDGDPRAVRAWAKREGYDVPDRGRIPSAVNEAYRNAH